MSEEVKRGEPNGLLTPEQVARYLVVTRRTVYNWIRKGTVFDPAKIVRFSQHIRIPLSEVERIRGQAKSKLETQSNI